MSTKVHCSVGSHATIGAHESPHDAALTFHAPNASLHSGGAVHAKRRSSSDTMKPSRPSVKPTACLPSRSSLRTWTFVRLATWCEMMMRKPM